MNVKEITPFSQDLQRKIDLLKALRKPLKIGDVSFASPLIMAPLASITTPPWRLLMEDLGAGGTVSELISCHGITYENDKTLKMLKIDPLEQNVGIQLFGEEAEALSHAAVVAEGFGAKFIDLNMGCPVRKVVGKGAGAALMQTPEKVGPLLRAIKEKIKIPLTIKIRIGWNEEQKNAAEIIHIAKEEGVNFVALHGRTRVQQYGGKADWDFIEKMALESPLPLIGNGDLHTPALVKERLKKTQCQGLMLGRGPLRNPFIFLESLSEDQALSFTAKDHDEIIKRFYAYNAQHFDREKTVLIQMKKHIVWFATGYHGAAHFRGTIFKTPKIEDVLRLSEDFFLALGEKQKHLNSHEAFLVSGEG